MVCFKKREKDLEIHFKWRLCTDFPCLLLFACWMMISGATFFILQKSSDVNALCIFFILISRLLNGRDYNGMICGSNDVNSTLQNNYIYYPKVNKDILVNDLLVSMHCIFQLKIEFKNKLSFWYLRESMSFGKDCHLYLRLFSPSFIRRGVGVLQSITSQIHYDRINVPKLLDCNHQYHFYSVSVFISIVITSNRCIPTSASKVQTTSVCTIPSEKVDPTDPRCLAKLTSVLETREESTSSSVILSMIINFSVIVSRWIGDVIAAYPLLIISFITAMICGYCFLVRIIIALALLSRDL